MKSAWSLQEWPRSELRAAVGDVRLDKLMCASGPVRKAARSDIPVVHPYARGSLQRTGAAAESPHNSSLVNFREADELFLQDRFAKSSQAPRESRCVGNMATLVPSSWGSDTAGHS